MKYLEVYQTIPENFGGCLTEKIQITLKFYWLEKIQKHRGFEEITVRPFKIIFNVISSYFDSKVTASWILDWIDPNLPYDLTRICGAEGGQGNCQFKKSGLFS